MTPLTKTITLSQRLSYDVFARIAHDEGRSVRQSPIGSRNTYQIDMGIDTRPLGSHWLHQCGYMYIQEAAASVPVQLLLDHLTKYKKSDTPLLVLDMAASPGGKTSQLAQGLKSS